MQEPVQIVFVKWGERYRMEIVQRMRLAIIRHSSRPVRFVCITDRPDEAEGLDMETRPFPPFAADFERLKAGCRLKLAIFALGLLAADMPTLFFDLDTVILGDVARLAEELERDRGLFMLRNHYLQWWKLPSWAKRLAGRRYYFGNSSVLGFYPADFHRIYESFNAEISAACAPDPKRISTDERYISYSAGGAVRVFPRRLVNKFAEEYMLPWPFIERLRKQLPWVKRRRAGLVAMSFVGSDFKPDRIVNFRKGTVLRYKRLAVRWDHDHLAAFYRRPLDETPER